MTTKGNVEVESIKVGDIHYEFEYGYCIKSEVISLPTFEYNAYGKKYWSWQNKHVETGRIINYGVTEDSEQYGPNLYDHEAYMGCKFL